MIPNWILWSLSVFLSISAAVFIYEIIHAEPDPEEEYWNKFNNGRW